MEKYLFVVFVVFAITSGADALDNGLALTPPMGWGTWERFKCLTDCVIYPDECISEQLIRKQADLMVSEGYLEAGYQYVIIDECWRAENPYEDGRPVPNAERFPNGMKALADYVHGKGLKFGISSEVVDCKNPLHYLEIDAKTFAEWGIDYLMFEGWCYNGIDDESYIKMGRYLNATGRPIVYLCDWPFYYEIGNKIDYAVITEYCNLWRNWYNTGDSWKGVTGILKWHGDNQGRIAKFVGPGHWTDIEYLIIGDSSLSFEQSKAQMAIWAIMASTLFMSTDLATIHRHDKAILLNKDVIAINQDKLGIQGRRVMTIDDIDVWTKPILPRNDEYHSYAIAFLSHREDGYHYRIVVSLTELKLEYKGGYVVESMFDDVVNPLSQFLLPNQTLEVRVKSSGVVLVRARIMC